MYILWFIHLLDPHANKAYVHKAQGHPPPPSYFTAGPSHPTYADKGVQTDPKKSALTKIKSVFRFKGKGKGKARRAMRVSEDEVHVF
jgi:hypothetical protein